MKGKLIVLSCAILSLTGCSCSFNGNGKEHTHAYDTAFHSNVEGHFHKCIYSGCSATSSFEKHKYDELKVCTVCGYAPCIHEWSEWYVVSLDGNVLEQDLTNDIPFFNIKTDNTPRDWFTFPLKNSLNLTAGTHTLRISMGSGYISTFYHFKLQNEN